MNKTGSRLLLLLIPALSFFSGYSQSNSPGSSLLWKISGNNIENASYLYGTMHLKDERLFNFSDSLYHFIENSEGFYIEADPQEIFNYLVKQSRNSNDSLEKPDELFSTGATKVASKNRKEKKENVNSKSDEMENFMDLYLFDIAQKQGKKTGGIEEVEDQLNEHGKLEEEGDEADPEILEKMIDIYLKEDLDGILEMLTDGSFIITDKSLIRRNIQMAGKIDSLSGITSNFFAIGAAHLPGDVGLIELLKKKGYTVEPVISKNTIHAKDYKFKQTKSPNWKTYSPSTIGWESKFPGKPEITKSEGQNASYWSSDFFTGAVYMVTDIKLPGSQFSPGEELKLHNNIKKNFQKEGKIKAERTFRFNGSMARQYIGTKNGTEIRMQVVRNRDNIHLLMVLGNKSVLFNPESENFFNSFQIKKPTSGNWVNFTNQEHAFTIELPLQPELNKKITENYNDSEKLKNWDFKVYTADDAVSGMYYMVTIKNPRAGYYLLDDQLMFSEVFPPSTVKKTYQREEKKSGDYNTLYAHVLHNDGYEVYNYQINRGNTNYILLVLCNPTNKDTVAIKKFFDSMEFLDYQTPVLTHQFSPDATVSTMIPGKFELIENEEGNLPSWVSQNGTVNYQIDRLTLGKYFEIKSDSAFFSVLKNFYLDSTENEVVAIRNLNQGDILSREILASTSKTSNYKRFRFVPNGDTVYIMHMIGLKEVVTSAEADQFFDSLKIYNEYPGKYYLEKKAGILFNDLYYGTEHTFKSASAAIEDFNFSENDLDNLHEALLEPFYDFNLWDYCTHDYIVKKVASMGHSSSIDFIKDNVYKLPKDKEELKYPLLGGLLQFQTAHSYNTFKQLLPQKLPAIGNPLIIANIIDDSLANETGLIPELLSKAGDSLFIRAISQMTYNWLLNDYIKAEDLLPYKKDFLNLASSMYTHLSKEKDFAVKHLLNNLIKIGDEECLAIVKKFENANELFASFEAVKAQLENGLNPEKVNIERLAASVYFRVKLYELHKKFNFSFPSKFASRKLLGESEIYIYSHERFVPSSVTYLKAVKHSINGVAGEFLLYKVVFEFENGAEEYLGVTGPFNLKDKNDKGLSEIRNIYTDEFFDKDNFEQQFKLHVEALNEN